MPVPDPTRVRAVSLWGQVLCGVLTTLGLLGLLRSGLSGFGEEPGVVFVFELHPVASIVHLVLGLAGTLLITRHGTARRFLTAVGALLVVWGLLTAVAGGSPRELLADDTDLAWLYLVAGAISLAVVHLPALRHPRAGTPSAGG